MAGSHFTSSVESHFARCFLSAHAHVDPDQSRLGFCFAIEVMRVGMLYAHAPARRAVQRPGACAEENVHAQEQPHSFVSGEIGGTGTKKEA